MRNHQNYRGTLTTADETHSFVPIQYSAKLVRSAFLGMLCVCTILTSPHSDADECQSSTVARKLNIEKLTIDFETLDDKKGGYVATLKNGDLVMASFLQCGLGMHAHFYSRNPVAKEQRAKTLRWFLAAVLPSQAAYASLEKQVNSTADFSDKKPHVFTGGNEEKHVFEFKASESPLFHTVLHYRWDSPAH